MTAKRAHYQMINSSKSIAFELPLIGLIATAGWHPTAARQRSWRLRSAPRRAPPSQRELALGSVCHYRDYVAL